MIHKQNGELLCECDECGHEHAGGTLEWSEFIADLKANGWKIKKDGDDWTHTCEECVAEEA